MVVHRYQSSNLVLSLFKNILKYCFNVKNCQLIYLKKSKIFIAHCVHSFYGKIFFLRFLVLFLRNLVALVIFQNTSGSSPLHLALLKDCRNFSLYGEWYMLFVRSLLCIGHKG